MKQTFSRRYRRHSSSLREGKMLKKDNQHEQTFFGGPSHESFFQPNMAIQRKCDHCEAEDKNVKRMAGDKEEEKKIQKMGEKKEEEKLQRQREKKEEEKEKEKVMRATDTKEEEKKLQRLPEKKEEEKIQKMDEKKEEDKIVHKKGDNEEEKNISKKENATSNNGLAATGTYIQSLSGKGQPLPENAQHFFGKRMGYDFSNVKIHTGIEAEKSAKDINAKAYTIDNNIVFNKGQYNPASADGKKLLAHELTHVMQQRSNEPELVSRVTEINDRRQEEEKPVMIQGAATKTQNKTSYGCAGVEVQGQTDANYKSSFKTTGKSRSSEACTDCTPPDCITAHGFVISKFKAHPVITLPNVPDGLTKCEARAVRNFINGTLKRHEQKHKRAFNTYNGTVKTPYNFTGCRAELDSLVQSLHDRVDTQRAADANALSDALDPFNVTIPCNCE